MVLGTETEDLIEAFTNRLVLAIGVIISKQRFHNFASSSSKITSWLSKSKLHIIIISAGELQEWKIDLSL